MSSEGYLHLVHMTSGQVQTSKSSTSSGARLDIGFDPSKRSKCSVEDEVLLSCYHLLELRMRNDFSCYTHPTSSSPMYLSSFWSIDGYNPNANVSFFFSEDSRSYEHW